MKMIRLMAVPLVAVAMVTHAESGQGIIDEATVLKAEPIYRTVRINEPVEECWEEQVQVPASSGYESHTPKIVGALVGAAVGNEFGKGRGKDLATVAGAVLGGSIGRDVQANSRSNNNRVVYEQHCETVDRYRTEERLVGYDVTYRYHDNVFYAFTDHDPGQVITVSVSVQPAE